MDTRISVSQGNTSNVRMFWNGDYESTRYLESISYSEYSTESGTDYSLCFYDTAGVSECFEKIDRY